VTDSDGGPAQEVMALEPDRTLVLDVLAGAITPETHASVFDEDVLLFSVRRLERDEPTWLLAQLANQEFPFDGRAAVFADTLRVRERALLLLRKEQPEFRRS
jgi:hypothetical protein